MEIIRQLCHNGVKHTPLPTGQYIVGCTDIMTAPTAGAKFGSFIRLFYPAEGDDILNYSSQWPTWIPDPKYIEGYADFSHMNHTIFRTIFKVASGQVHAPAIWNGQPHKKLSKCPVVIFSHGLGACRCSYFTICTELASRGFVVAAVEHRDKSACITYSLFDADKIDENERAPPKKEEKIEKDQNKDAEETTVDVRDTMDSTKIFPRSLTHEWLRYMRIGKDEDSYQIRNDQVHQRAQECIQAFELVELLNKGEFVDNLLDTSLSLQSSFRSLMDTSNAAIVGHSFGGATVLRTLSIQKDIFKVGIALDCYMFPVEKEMDLVNAIECPLLFINSETFSPPRNAKNMKLMDNEDRMRTFVIIKGTVHQSQADTPFVVGSLFRTLFGASSSLDRFLAMSINNSLMLNFLWKHLGFSGNDEIVKHIKQNDKHLMYGIHS